MIMVAQRVKTEMRSEKCETEVMDVKVGEAKQKARID